MCWRAMQDDAPISIAGSPKCAVTVLALLQNKDLDCELEVSLSLDRYESKSIMHAKEKY